MRMLPKESTWLSLHSFPESYYCVVFTLPSSFYTQTLLHINSHILSILFLCSLYLIYMSTAILLYTLLLSQNPLAPFVPAAPPPPPPPLFPPIFRLSSSLFLPRSPQSNFFLYIRPSDELSAPIFSQLLQAPGPLTYTDQSDQSGPRKLLPTAHCPVAVKQQQQTLGC